jgi:hypothetical protein
MTILGQHTVSETRDLIRACEFRLNKYLQQYQRIQSTRLNPPTAEQRKLDDDVVAFVREWTNTRDRETLVMTAAMLANPSVMPFVLPAEKSYKAVDAVFRERIPHFKDIQQRIDAEAVTLQMPPPDLTAIPPQDSPDADFVALKKLDEAIAAAGNPLGKPGGTDSAAKSPLGMILIGGAVIAAVGGALYVKKVVF